MYQYHVNFTKISPCQISEKWNITIDFNGNFGHLWGVITHYSHGQCH